ncbi:hypothetical protein [Streptomyces sp. BP-8]|uniref:L,D-transpeptidase n=1 Tax=Streptomyces sirii TaxID=3127701 RepID=A0ABZ2QWA1_9ACTN
MPSKSSTIVTALTTAAVVVVGFLGYQAAASAPDSLTPARKDGHSASKGHSDRPGKKAGTSAPVSVPAASGKGRRVVYSLGGKRIWLVDAKGGALRTFTVTPSTVHPPLGTYTVGSRSVSVTGSDGIAIEHVVRFTTVDAVTIGFSAAVDGSRPDPGSSKRTGGIRESREDGKAMWDFALQGTKVVVVA